MIANIHWTKALRDAQRRSEALVLVSVGDARGSTPREAGTTMAVTKDATAGTIGGGHLEFEAIRLARAALAQSPAPPASAVRFPLAARLGQCCGGVATLLFSIVDPSDRWLDDVDEAQHAGVACAIVLPLEPAGKRCVVTATGIAGSLGEATLDAAAVHDARTRLGRADGGSGVVDLDGRKLFVHVVRPCPFQVRIFGNGHVGRALVQVLGALPAEVAWVDTREHDFPARVPANVTIVATDEPVAEVANAPRGASLVVLTHSHALDFDIVEAALAREDLGYVGLIGSTSKRAQFERRLVQRGRQAAAIARLTCPVGVAFASKEPGTIAVGIAAELLRVREARMSPGDARPAPVDAGVPIGARMPALPSRPAPD